MILHSKLLYSRILDEEAQEQKLGRRNLQNGSISFDQYHRHSNVSRGYFQNGYEHERFKQGVEIYACGFRTLLVHSNNFYCWIEQAWFVEKVLRVFASQPLVFCDNVLPSSSHLLEIYYSFSRLSVDPIVTSFSRIFQFWVESPTSSSIWPAISSCLLPSTSWEEDCVFWGRRLLNTSQPQLLWIAVADTILNSSGRDSRSHS